MTGNDTVIIRDLRNQVKTLKLEAEKAQLLAGKNAPPPDIAQSLGAGQLDPQVQQELQSRMFQIQPPQPQEPSWLGQVFSTLVQALLSERQAKSSGISEALSLLAALGVDLKGIMNSRNAPKSEGGIQLGNVSLPAGTVLTEPLLLELIRWDTQKSQEVAEREKTASTLERMGQVIADVISEAKADAAGLSSRPPNIEAKAQQTAATTLSCPQCGAEISTENLVPGARVKCKSCETEFEVEEPPRTEVKKSRKRVVQKREQEPEPEEEPTVLCPKCRQVISVSGHEAGDQVKCPACGLDLKLVSGEPAPAAEPALDAFSERELQFRRSEQDLLKGRKK